MVIGGGAIEPVVLKVDKTLLVEGGAKHIP